MDVRDFIRPRITNKSFGLYGHVDFINSEGIGGWVIDVQSSEPRVVEVYMNDEKVGEAIANLPRADISSIIGREALCGFYIKWSNINLPKSIRLEDSIDVAVIDKLSGREIVGKHAKGREPKIFVSEKKSKVDENTYKVRHHTYEKLSFPRFDNPRVSIIIPVHNKFDYTYGCLKSILENTDESIPYEIIVADDCSTDETMYMHEFIDGVYVIRNATNLGFLRNVNNASRLAKGEFLVILNNDTIVPKGWLKEFIRTFEMDSKIGIVGPKFLFPDGKLQEAGGIIWKDATGWNFGRGADPLLPEYNYLKEVDYISGACLMIKKEVWDKLGGFDERFAPAYFEDSDLAFSCRSIGYKVVYQPKVEVIHFEGISHGTDTSKGIKRYQEINRSKFIEKWKEVLEREHLPNGVDPFLARDRSVNRRHLLVIDHYVPMYDIGAGERTIYMWLKVLKDYFQITFIGENFYKHEPYTTELQQMGIEVLYGPYYASNYEEWMRKHLKYFDFVLLSRAHIAKRFIDTIEKYFKKTILYYPHDLSYIRLLREYELKKDERILKEADRLKSLEYEMFSKADIILLPSEVEKDLIKHDFPSKKIVVVPPFVYEGSFPLAPNSDFHSRHGILFLGGFRHHTNAPSIKWFVEKVWNRILVEVPEAILYIAGADCPPEIYDLQNRFKNVKVLGFIPEERLKELYNTVRIVIAPLLFGAGVKGKVVEAIAYGVPVVTTTIGAEGIADISKVAIVADGEEYFAKTVCELYTNQDLWRQLRANSKVYSERYLSKENLLSVFKECFKIEEGIQKIGG